MRELEQILQTWTEAQARGESGVLATVVRVHGSSYRRPGARLLLTSGGRRAGSVSGGCLEADLVRKAWWLTENGKSVVRRYDTTSEGEIAQEFGLGCNGVIHLLLERLESVAVSPLSAIGPIRTTRNRAVFATVVHSSDESLVRVGQRWTRHADGQIQTDLSDGGLCNQLAQEAPAVMSEASSEAISRIFTWASDQVSADIFIEIVPPPVRLLIFGAGEDAVPMARMARFLGYEVIVIDGRSHFARRDRFPDADQVLVNSERDPLSGITLDRRTVCLLMTHSYAQDLAALRAIGHKSAAYVGVLGPRKRTQQMVLEAGLALEEHAGGLHSPMGLDIGADGAEEIALAAIAEIQAALHGRRGGMLRDKAGPMHSIGPDPGADVFTGPRACPIDS